MITTLAGCVCILKKRFSFLLQNRVLFLISINFSIAVAKFALNMGVIKAIFHPLPSCWGKLTCSVLSSSLSFLLHPPVPLQLMHALSQQSTSSPCKQLHCSHICLLAPAVWTRGRGGARWELSAVCRCPRGLMLSPDGASCSPPVDDSFILLLSPTALHQVAIIILA